jgi:hypothetical protein
VNEQDKNMFRKKRKRGRGGMERNKNFAGKAQISVGKVETREGKIQKSTKVDQVDQCVKKNSV